MIGILLPLAIVAGSFSRVMRLGDEMMRARFSPSRACREMSSAKLEASQPSVRPNRFPCANAGPSTDAGKFAAVDGATDGGVSPPREVRLPAPPRTSTIGEFWPALGVKAP